MTYVAEAARLPALIGQRAGSGPALLLLPGLGSTLTEFRAVLPSLIQRYECWPSSWGKDDHPPFPPPLRRPSRPHRSRGAGAGSAGCRRATRAGSVSRGRLGLELARRQRARSVVAIGPTGQLTPPERIYQAAMLTASRLAFRAAAPVADTLMRPLGLRAAALALLRARAWRTAPDQAAALVRAFAGAEDFWRLLGCAILPEATLNYRAVRCPVRIAQGTHDLVSLSQAAWLRVLVPGARFRVLPFAGHSSIADVPQRVIALVDEAAAAAGSPSSPSGQRPHP
jgi:hypothetical protein